MMPLNHPLKVENTMLDLEILQRRRRGVMQLMGDGIAVMPTAPVVYRNRDITYKYRPDSDFYYLTHFPEPEGVAVLDAQNDKFILFCRENHPQKEQWDGSRYGLEGAVEFFGADEAYPFSEMDKRLPKLMQNQSKVFCNLGRYPVFDRQLIEYLREIRDQSRNGFTVPAEFVDIGPILHEMRLIKRVDEKRTLKKAGKITSQAHVEAIKACRPGLYEYELQALIEYQFAKNGCAAPSYPSIVAGGKNACILHYIENKALLKDGDLLLVDAGCEYDGYAADITRTYPVNGVFTPPQKDLYEIVLQSQFDALDQIKPGLPWNAFHDAAVKTIAQGLIDLKLLSGSLEEVLETASYKPFYMHRTGHWLGMDVHDVGDYKVEGVWRQLEAGMCLTIEPGIYIPTDPNIDSKWHGIGIRIEDDVIINKNGYDMITQVPKKVAEIEQMMAQAKESR